jgi:ABC-type multidrug transport system fused ATPase/permease subunit
MDRLEFYHHVYDKEIERKMELDGSIGIHLSLFSVFAAALYFFYTNFNFAEFSIIDIVMLVLMVLSFILLFISFFNLLNFYVKAGKGNTYKYLDYCSIIEDAKKVYEDHYKSFKNKQVLADKQLEEYLIESLIEMRDHNFKVNIERSKYVLNAKQALMIAFAILSLLIIAHFTKNYIEGGSAYSETGRIEIIKPFETNIYETENSKKLDTIINILKTYKQKLDEQDKKTKTTR